MVEEKNDHTSTTNAEVKTFKDVKERFSNSVQRNKGKLMVTLVVLGVLLIGGTIKLINYSSSPGFCVLFCHEMVPEYRTWKQSVHEKHGVECHGCHYEPGIMGVVKAKWRAQGQLFSHILGSYLDNNLEKAQKENLFLEVQNIHQEGDRRFYIKADEHGVKIVNDNCIRCHANVTEQDVITEERGVRVPHRTHVVDNQVHCTDCHINIVHGEDLAKRNLPKMRMCFRCHNKEGNKEKLSKENCRNCHVAQESMWAGKGGYGAKTVTSAMYGSVDCVECHTPENSYRKPQGTTVCLDCHDKDVLVKYNTMREKLKVSRLQLQERIQTVEEKFAYAKEKKTSPEQKAAIEQAEAIFKEGKANLQLVNQDGSNGIHNNEYALALLEVAKTKVKESLAILP